MSSGCILLGSGGHARVVIAAARAGGLTVQALHDSDSGRQGQILDSVTIVGGDDAAFASGLPLHAAIGRNRTRLALAARTPDAGWLAIIHPEARLAGEIEVGDGALVGMGALVQPGARIGRHAIINTGAIIEHDVTVGDFAHVAPGAVLGGSVTVGEGALIGLGARVLPGVRIGPWSVVGAGAVVTGDVAEGETVAGVPARRIGPS